MKTNSEQIINQAALDYLASGPKKILIDGKWVSALSNKFFETSNPATEEIIGSIAEGGERDIQLAVEAAQRAFENPSWSNITPHQREVYLHRIADLIEEHAEELATIETLDNGMSLATSAMLVRGAIDTFRYYAGWPTKMYGKTNPSEGSSFTYTLREPLGVCGAIVPWNGPIQAVAWKIAPAIAFGNTIIVKPSSFTSLTCLRLGELIVESGLPDGVVNIVTGLGSVAGAALVEHPGISKISFTGSTPVGKGILKSAAETMKKVTLELGGKSANIIFPDADLDKAINGAIIGFTAGAGQGCVAGSRVFIHESIYEQVAAKIIEKAKAIIVGPGIDETNTMGPITTKNQFEKIQTYFQIGKDDGATLAVGGARVGSQGYFLEPTVFTNVKNGMRLAQEEIFGPVVALISFKDENDVIFQANDTEFGLAAMIWTKDISRGLQVAKAMKAGTVWINTLFELDPITPFGGYKQSGIGKELGAESIDAYTQIKAVVVRF